MNKTTKQELWAVDPFGESSLLNDALFDSPYGELRELLRSHNITIHTYDKTDLKSVDKVLCINYHPAFIRQCDLAHVPKSKRVLLAMEPPVVIPEQYRPSIWDNFDQVFTFRDDLVDNKHIFKLRYPQGQSVMESLPDFSSRKFLTLINANRYSYVNNELYGLRREAIRFFDRYPHFDLYGHRWDDKRVVISPRNVVSALKRGKPITLIRNVYNALRPYRSWRGSVKNKYETLALYRFCLCYENEKLSPGYLTEKIFDCYFTGTVPIYLGASNITDYVPQDSFIDMRDFEGFDAVQKYLEQMTEPEWNKLHLAGQEFIQSEQFMSTWRPKAVFNEIINQLLKKEDTQ